MMPTIGAVAPHFNCKRYWSCIANRQGDIVALDLYNAWLVLAAGEERQHAGNDGYDDHPSTHYSWDSTVPNCERIAAGDLIVLWDKQQLLGASVIESVRSDPGRKLRYRCPVCSLASFKERKTKRPRYLCFKCHSEFDEPDSREDDITTYRSEHGAAWADLNGMLSGEELRRLCVSESSQLSIRPFRWAAFREALEAAAVPEHLLVHLVAREGQLQGGHVERIVRARVGQGRFRSSLLSAFGSSCAFTGPNPPEALEAAHLYSYAQLGRHEEHGGLLLRRDLHRLFDDGLIAVEPDNKTLDVSEALDQFPHYTELQGQSLTVALDRGSLGWLRQHWTQHRGEG
jgi:hypothetical protein